MTSRPDVSRPADSDQRRPTDESTNPFGVCRDCPEPARPTCVCGHAEHTACHCGCTIFETERAADLPAKQPVLEARDSYHGKYGGGYTLAEPVKFNNRR